MAGQSSRRDDRPAHQHGRDETRTRGLGDRLPLGDHQSIPLAPGQTFRHSQHLLWPSAFGYRQTGQNLSVEDNGGVYIVPAFSGLCAPYWKDTARGVITGLTRYANKSHISRAVREATAFQTCEVVEAMEADSGNAFEQLRTDGGMVNNNLLMQFQADLLGRKVIRPAMKETTALGAAYAAELACGFYKDTSDLVSNWSIDQTWQAEIAPNERERLYKQWKKMVTRSFDWVDD